MRNKLEAIKNDQGKARLDLISPSLLFGLGQALEFGARKYSPNNWRRGFVYSRPFASMMRHLWKWWQGQDKDEESGMSHLWHAATCLMMLIEFEDLNLGQDDRPSVFLQSLETKDEQ